MCVWWAGHDGAQAAASKRFCWGVPCKGQGPLRCESSLAQPEKVPLWHMTTLEEKQKKVSRIAFSHAN